jgi:hypothetical protein
MATERAAHDQLDAFVDVRRTTSALRTVLTRPRAQASPKATYVFDGERGAKEARLCRARADGADDCVTVRAPPGLSLSPR